MGDLLLDIDYARPLHFYTSILYCGPYSKGSNVLIVRSRPVGVLWMSVG
jgi:hypothetical protein